MSASAQPFAERLAEDAQQSAILLDYDGCLAPIVDDPSAAVPFPGTRQVLVDLAKRYRVVAVISGRPVTFLAEHLIEPGITNRPRLYGKYGAELLDEENRLEVVPASIEPSLIDALVADVRQEIPLARVEDKTTSITLHWREHPEIAAQVSDLALAFATRHHLSAQPGRASIELLALSSPDKGSAVLHAARDCRSVLFVGDDRADLAAFDALDELQRRGLSSMRAVAMSDETPAELAERADFTLPGPQGVHDFLVLCAS